MKKLLFLFVTMLASVSMWADNLYLLKNVETGKYLNAGNDWGTQAVLADDALPVQLTQQPDGSYTIYFPVGSCNQQLLYRASEKGVYVDYNEEFDGACPYWTITDIGGGNYHIQSLTTHPTYGQTAMEGTYLGNNPTLDPNNNVDGNVYNAEGMNITWKLEQVPATRTEAQITKLEGLITTAQGLGLSTDDATSALTNENTYIGIFEAIFSLQNRVNEETDRINNKVQDLNKLIACANAVGVNTEAAQTVADNPANMVAVTNAISTLRAAYIDALGNGVDASLLPLDVTGAIVNPSFTNDNNEGWTWGENEEPTDMGHHNVEYRERTFNFRQTISGLPDGYYVLKVKGFHQPGNINTVINDYYTKSENWVTAMLYANNRSMKLKNVAEETRDSQIDGWSGLEVTCSGQTRFVPCNQHDGEVWFANGYYENELTFAVTNGTVTIGVNKGNIYDDDDWVVFDDFRLTYLGTEGLKFLKNVETGKYLNAGNDWGTQAVLADDALPVQLNQQGDGSYTIYFPVGSQNQQLLFRDSEQGVYVDYAGQESGCPYWTITDAGEGNYHIQSLTTHPTYGQTAMPDTYLGNNPTLDPNNNVPNNNVYGNVYNAEGMNITWKLEAAPLTRTDQQLAKLENQLLDAQSLGISTSEEAPLVNNANTPYLDMLAAILSLQKRIDEKVRTNTIISFADANVKTICVHEWDTNGDGELSVGEAEEVTDLGEVFRGNTEITSFNELEYFTGLTSIGNQAFEGCSGLTSVSIPSNVTSIGILAFEGCSSLTSISIPSSVSSIGAGAFEGCSSLTSISIPSSVTSIGDDAFAGCSGLTKVIVSDIAAWCNIAFNNNCYSNPLYYAHHLYSDENTEITDLVIPEGVTSIGSWAFIGCSGLTSVNIPNSVTNIGSDAFNGCTGLTSIVVSEDNTAYDSRNNCKAIINSNTKELIVGCNNTVIPDNVTSIGNRAFEGCAGLTSVNIPNSVTSIGFNAFRYCAGLTSVTIPNGVTSIGASAFEGCSGLTSVIIPNSVTSIGDYVFYKCFNLTSVTVLRSPITIDQYCFSNLATATLHVPAGSTDEYQAADYWKEFKEIVVIPNITFADTNVKAICVANWDTNGDGELSEGEAAVVTNLGEVFKGNTEITSFNELQYFTGLTSIGYKAFSNTSIETVVLPSTAILGEDMFKDCNKLESVTFLSGEPGEKHFANNFQGCPDDVLFTIPEGASAENYLKRGFRNLSDKSALYKVKELFENEKGLITGMANNEQFTNVDKTALSAAISEASGIVTATNDYLTVYAQIDAIKDAAKAFLATATLPNDFDVTAAMITNSDNDWYDIGWTIGFLGENNGWQGDAAYTNEECTIQNFIEGWLPGNTLRDGKLSQVIKQLPAGKYRLVAKAIASWQDDAEQEVTGVRLYMGNQSVPVATANVKPEFFSVEFSNFETQDVEIGLKTESTTANWVALDDVRLTYLGVADVSEAIYFVKNVETGKYLSKGNDWGMQAVLADEPLPARISKQEDGSYTFYFPVGSQFQQQLFRDNEQNVFVDYQGQENGCPYWNITVAGNGNFHIQTLTTHATYGQTAMPGTFLGNDPTREPANNVDGNVLNTDGMNITWQFIPEGLHTTAQTTRLTALIAEAETLDINTNDAQTVLEDEDATYTEMLGQILQLEGLVNEENKRREPIEFADANVKALCLDNWNTNDDEELSRGEAAAVTNLGNVFKGNTEITSFEELQYFTGLTEIGDCAFQGCSNLASVTLPDGLIRIGGCEDGGAFNQSGLTSITFPPSLTEVGNAAFQSCNQLTSINFNGCTATLVGDAFSWCNALEEVYIPNTITLTGCWNFACCANLRRVEFEAGNPSVNTCATLGAYGNPKLETVILPSTEIMGTNFFQNCTGLQHVTFLSGTPGEKHFANNFQGVPNDVLFTIPEGTAEAFLTRGFRNLSDVSGLPLVKAEFGAEVTRIQAMAGELNSGDNDALTAAISAASGIVNDADNYLTVYEQIEAIKAAAKTYLATATLPAGFDVTAAYITNPNAESLDIGWSVGYLGEHNGLQTESKYTNGEVSIDHILEGWSPSNTLGDGKISQTITNLPAGIYRLECDAIATWSEDASVEVTGVSLFAGTQTKAMATENEHPQHFTLSFDNPTTKDVNIGVILKNTNANWVAFDNVRLYYKGPAAAAPEGTELVSSEDATYYIYNVGTGMYLSGGNGWGTQAVLAETGLPVRMTRDEDGYWQVYFREGSRHQQLLYSDAPGVYTDCQNNGDQTLWAITESNGSYTIQSFGDLNTNFLLGNDPTRRDIDLRENQLLDTHIDVIRTENIANNTRWQFIKKADYDLYMAKRYLLTTIFRLRNSDANNEAEALLTSAQAVYDNNSSTYDEVVAATTMLNSQIGMPQENQPVDMTALIINPRFENNTSEGWTGAKLTEDGNAQNTQHQTHEFFHTNFNMYQTITGLPNGLYRLKWKGFHRPGNCEQVCADFINGTNNASAVVYANNVVKTMKHIYTDANDIRLDESDSQYDGKFVPFRQWGVRAYFDEGLYADHLEVEVTNNVLTIGVKNTQEMGSDHWVIFSDFELEILQNAETYNNHLSINNISSVPGGSATLPIQLANTDQIVSFSVDVHLPEGVVPKTDNSGNIIVKKASRVPMTVMGSVMADGTCRFAALTNGEAISGISGEIFSFVILPAGNMELGEYQVRVDNIKLVNDQLLRIQPFGTTSTLTLNEAASGDVNGDSEVDITDATIIVYYVLGRNPAINLDAGDINGDGLVDILDATIIVYHVLGRDTNPAAARQIALPEPQ